MTTSSAVPRPPSRPSSQADGDGGGEQPEPQVDPGGQRGQRAGVGDVRQRVAGEHLAAQHDEVADQPGQQRDRGAGEQRVLDERLRRACSPAR